MGKRVLVIGASTGIGRATAQALAEAGAVVAVAGRRQAELEDLCGELGPQHSAIRCDVRDPRDCDTVVSSAVESLGGLDGLVYCAGVSRLMPLAKADATLWQDVLETNLVGASLTCRAAIPHLRESGGRAVFLGSNSVGRPIPGLSVYAVSKAALAELIVGWQTENPDVLFTNVVVGPTFGTGFREDWDPAVALSMPEFWKQHGLLSTAPPMQAADVGALVSSIVHNPAPVWNIDVHSYDPTAKPLIR